MPARSKPASAPLRVVPDWAPAARAFHPPQLQTGAVALWRNCDTPPRWRPASHSSRTLVPLSQRERGAWLWQPARPRRIDPGVVRHDRGPHELEVTSEEPALPGAPTELDSHRPLHRRRPPLLVGRVLPLMIAPV